VLRVRANAGEERQSIRGLKVFCPRGEKLAEKERLVRIYGGAF